MIPRRAARLPATFLLPVTLVLLILPAGGRESRRNLSVVAVGDGQRMYLDEPEDLVQPGFNPEMMGYPPRVLAPGGQTGRDDRVESLQVGMNASGSRLGIPTEAGSIRLFEPPPTGAPENAVARLFVSVDLPAGNDDLMMLVFRDPPDSAWRDDPGTLVVPDGPEVVPEGGARVIHLGSRPAFVRIAGEARRLAPLEVAIIPEAVADEQFAYALGWNSGGGNAPDEFREGAVFATPDLRMNLVIHDAPSVEGRAPGEPFGVRMFPQIDDVPAPPEIILRSDVPDIGGEAGEED